MTSGVGCRVFFVYSWTGQEVELGFRQWLAVKFKQSALCGRVLMHAFEQTREMRSCLRRCWSHAALVVRRP